jgi:hypothetical protein
MLNKLERHLGRYAIRDLPLYFVIGQVLVWSLAFFKLFDVEKIALLPVAVLEGEVWRAVSFLWLPPNSHPVFIAFAWYLFWMFGNSLEDYWGVFRFNAFVFTGWLLTTAVAFLTPGSYTTNLFLAGSVFLAFAFLNPDFEMMIFFILPVKIKWLALIQWIGYGYVMIAGGWTARLAVLAAVGNFLLFFSREIVDRIRTGRRHMQQQARRASMREAADEPRHRCVVCGKTDLSHPMEDFRYGDDDQCYCAEHRGGKKA